MEMVTLLLLTTVCKQVSASAAAFCRKNSSAGANLDIVFVETSKLEGQIRLPKAWDILKHVAPVAQIRLGDSVTGDDFGQTFGSTVGQLANEDQGKIGRTLVLVAEFDQAVAQLQLVGQVLVDHQDGRFGLFVRRVDQQASDHHPRLFPFANLYLERILGVPEAYARRQHAPVDEQR
ncbi:hypothetical protein Tsp_15800, partial [Trichinella spiralis]|uniref:hypothetical protein n=1 Tax=Trichinella spiralis TaxID=6334 RepID=UPI0001EFD2F3